MERLRHCNSVGAKHLVTLHSDLQHFTTQVLSVCAAFHTDATLRVELTLNANSQLCFFFFNRMSSVEVNDENRGVCPGGKQHNSTSNDIFVLDQPTGRPSILRQTENLPSKALPKGVKVLKLLHLIFRQFRQGGCRVSHCVLRFAFDLTPSPGFKSFCGPQIFTVETQVLGRFFSATNSRVTLVLFSI